MKEHNTCAKCGCIHAHLFEVEIDGETLQLCGSCLASEGFVVCSDCGDIISEDESLITDDGETICQSCYEDNYCTCEECGAIVHTSDIYRVNPDCRDEGYVCEQCCDYHYTYCDCCGDYFSSDHIALEGDNGTNICYRCSNSYAQCNDCDGVHHIDYMTYDNYSDHWYCDDCYANHANHSFHDYSYKPEPEFQYRRGEAHNCLTFGLELEVDQGDDQNELTDALASLDKPIYMKRDGSLGSEGVEIVTHPCSLAFHQYQLRWAEICRVCIRHGYSSHDAETCGLHIHVGRHQMGEFQVARDRAAGNLVLLANTLKRELTKFSRRKQAQLDDWAVFPDLWQVADEDADDPYTDAQLTEIALDTESHGRYQAVNLTNRETVEFRFFRGTLKRETIIASIQLVSNLTKYAMTHTPRSCLHASFADVLAVEEFKELRTYCLSQGLC